MQSYPRPTAPPRENAARLRPLLIGLLAGLIYWATPIVLRGPETHAAVYFNHLADAFLHGRLHLLDPPLTYDLTQFDGRWYVPFPPGPALLMLPFVAALGPEARFVVPLAAALGGLSAGLVYLALRAMRDRDWIEADERAALWLTGLFAFGTGLWAAAPTGSVWYVAHVVTVTFTALALALATRRAQPFWIGAALAGAALTRPHIALAGMFFAAELWVRAQEAGQPTRAWLRRLILLLAPLAVAGAGLLWYNWARFGDPLDFGYRAAQVAPELAEALAEHGQFSLHYAARNLRLAAAGMPSWQWHFPFFTPTVAGMSVFLTTPALLYLFRRPPRRAWEWAAWAVLLSLGVTHLLYYNTGWQQFGYRFSLDYAVFAVCLAAANAGRRVSPALACLIVLSALVNLRGVVWWFGGG